MGYKLQLGMGTSTGLGNVLAEGGKILFTTDDGLLHIDTTDATDKSGRIAVNATKAKKDWSGNTITSTYIKGLSISGSTITYTYGDGTSKTITAPNTTYSAGVGLTLSGTTFNVGAGTGISVTDDAVGLATSGVTAGNYGEDANATLKHSDTFVVPKITVDAYGRVTSAANYTMTLPSSGNTDTKVTQAYSTADGSYPLLFSDTAGVTSTSSRGAKTAILNNAIYANPKNGYIYATKFKGAADTADKFTTSHSITIGNQTETYDGSANATFTIADIGAAPASHNHSAAHITSGTLSVARGGTGATSVKAGGVVYGASTSAYGSVVGTAGQILKSNGASAPEWITPSTSLTAYKVSKQLTVGSKKYDGSSAVTITAADLGVGNALHFIGIVDALPTTGTSGDVVILSTNHKEYIWNGAATSPAWEELGDEGSYVVKGAVTIQGTGALGGSGTVGDTGTISITHDTTGSAAKSNSTQTKTISGSAGTGSFTIPVIAVDTYGHVKYTGDSTITITMPTIPTIPTHRTLTIAGSSTAATSATVGYSAGSSYNPVGSANITATIYSVKGATASAAGIAGLVPAPAAGATNRVLTANGQWTAATAIGAVEWVDF